MDWLVSSRIEFLHSMKDGRPIQYFAAHLPVMATWSESSLFPVNMTVKGLGLLPEKEQLQHYTDIFESVITAARSSPWNESIHQRMKAMAELYGDEKNFDSAVLGGLEIFGGKALENLKKNPYASLLYAGMTNGDDGAVRYISFQVNCKVTILEKENPYYRFLLASRKLFEFEKFHLYQPDYPLAYLFHVVDVIDKSPWSRKSGGD